MPPKAARVSASTAGVDNPAFQYVFSVFKHCDSITLNKPDWNEVAKEHGIAYGKNASDLPHISSPSLSHRSTNDKNSSARFKSIVENHGLAYGNNTITSPNGVGAAVATAAPSADTDSAPPKTPKSRGRKRKADGDDATEDTPKKKASTGKGGKKSQPVKEEEPAEDGKLVKEEDDVEGSGAEEAKDEDKK